MNKLWGSLLVLSCIAWVIDAIGLFFGYKPDKFTIFIAFIMTAIRMGQWAYNEFNDSDSL